METKAQLGSENSELRGRIEELDQLVEYQSLRLDSNLSESTEYLLGSVGESGAERISNTVVLTVRSARALEAYGWIMAMREAGINDEDILRAWDRKHSREREAEKEIERQEM